MPHIGPPSPLARDGYSLDSIGTNINTSAAYPSWFSILLSILNSVIKNGAVIDRVLYYTV